MVWRGVDEPGHEVPGKQQGRGHRRGHHHTAHARVARLYPPLGAGAEEQETSQRHERPEAGAAKHGGDDGSAVEGRAPDIILHRRLCVWLRFDGRWRRRRREPRGA